MFRDEARRLSLRLLLWACLSLLLAMALGTYLRSVLVWAWPLAIRYGNAVHAHSHVAYFGWGGLGLMGAAYWLLPSVTPGPPDGRAALSLQGWLGPLAVSGAFVTFALWGYGGASIAFSVLNEVVWYLFAWTLWRSVRHLPPRRWPAWLVLLAGATVQLVLSTLGTWFLVAAILLGRRTDLIQMAGVQWFLHVYGNGWLLLGAMALVAALLPRLGGRPLPAGPAWWLAALQMPAALGFVLVLPRAALAPWAVAAGLVGVALQTLIPFWFLILAARAWPPRAGGRRAGPQWGFAGLAAGWLLGLSLMEAAAFLPAWATWATNRQLILAHLHLKLLGIVSGALLAWLTATFARQGARWRLWLSLYALGVLLMVTALAGAGLLSPTVAWGRFWLGLALAAGAMLLTGAAAVAAPLLLRLGRRTPA